VDGYLNSPHLRMSMEQEAEIRTADEYVPTSIKIMMLIAFLVLLNVLIVDIFEFVSLL
jgi:hypothetical protein